jgi:hypothetical protein
MQAPKRARKSDEAFEILSTMIKRTLEKEDAINQLRNEETQRLRDEYSAKEAALKERIRQLEAQPEALMLENKRLQDELNTKSASSEALRTRVNVLLDRELQLDAREDCLRCAEERIASSPTASGGKGRSQQRLTFVFTYTGTSLDPQELNAIAARMGMPTQIKEIVEIVEVGMHFCRLSLVCKRTEEFVMNVIKNYYCHMRAKHPDTFTMAFSPVFAHNPAEPWRAAIINNSLASPAVRFARAPLWAWYTKMNDNYAGVVMRPAVAP